MFDRAYAARLERERKLGKCVPNYHDGCKHREVCDVPFCADWCCLKNTYCDNVKPEIE